MSFYSVLADFVTTVHFAYVSFVVVGQLAIMLGWALGWRWIRNPWFRGAHLTMILIVAVEAYFDIMCPLTTWELQLRVLAGELIENNGSFLAGAADLSFVARLLHPLFLFDSVVDHLDKCYYAFAGLTLATTLLIPPYFRRSPA